MMEERIERDLFNLSTEVYRVNFATAKIQAEVENILKEVQKTPPGWKISTVLVSLLSAALLISALLLASFFGGVFYGAKIHRDADRARIHPKSAHHASPSEAPAQPAPSPIAETPPSLVFPPAHVSSPAPVSAPAIKDGSSLGPVPSALEAALVKPISEPEFDFLAASPGVRLFPENPEAPKLIMFSWTGCPSCRRMIRYFDQTKANYDFQVLFVPLAGLPNLDAAALSFLSAQEKPREEQEEILKKLALGSALLGAKTGALKVPSFAWREPDGSVHLDNLDAAELRRVLQRLKESN